MIEKQLIQARPLGNEVKFLKSMTSKAFPEKSTSFFHPIQNNRQTLYSIFLTQVFFSI